MEFVFTEYFQLETDKGYSFPQKIREINTSNTVSRFHEIFLRYAHVIPILAFRSSLQLAIEPTEFLSCSNKYSFYCSKVAILG